MSENRQKELEFLKNDLVEQEKDKDKQIENLLATINQLNEVISSIDESKQHETDDMDQIAELKMKRWIELVEGKEEEIQDLFKLLEEKGEYLTKRNADVADLKREMHSKDKSMEQMKQSLQDLQSSIQEKEEKIPVNFSLQRITKFKSQIASLNQCIKINPFL